VDQGVQLLSLLRAEPHDILLDGDLSRDHESAPTVVPGRSIRRFTAKSMTWGTSRSTGGRSAVPEPPHDIAAVPGLLPLLPLGRGNLDLYSILYELLFGDFSTYRRVWWVSYVDPDTYANRASGYLPTV
jgi:hypothetical protein